MANKLELTWVGKENEIQVEPRILIENPALGNMSHKTAGQTSIFDTENTDSFDNMLIHGDNLLALKALESKFAGQVKCIYIDPPYNIDAANEHYDDFVEHSAWLSLMKPRLTILKNLLATDGVIFIQINDEEQAYLQVLCNEIFGRGNFVNIVSVNMKNGAGASGGGEDKRLKKNCEFILIYAKDYDLLRPFNSVYEYTEIMKVLEEYKNQNKNWHYTSVLVEKGTPVYVGSTLDGDGNEIRIYKREGAVIKSIRQIIEETGLTEKEVYYKYGQFVFEAKDAQSSIRTRIASAKRNFGIVDDVISIEYVPKTGRNKGMMYEQFYKGDKCRLFAWLKDICESKEGILYKRDKQGTYWDFTQYINNLNKEGSVPFSNSKKPEALIERILLMSTTKDDLVLDSFLGSGTTAAVAQKMGRRWIGIEMGDHAYTHCKVRLDKVIDGSDQVGITKSANWKGGGGYRFYELAPTLVVTDKFGNPVINKEYNADMLAAAMALQEGFTYCPDDTFYWKQGKNENAYIFTTTSHVTADYLASIHSEMQDDEYLVIACKTYDSGIEKLFKNITVKKIPQVLLGRCEFGKNDYSLNIVDMRVMEEEE